MMNNFALIISTAIIVYFCRLSGFTVSLSSNSMKWQSFSNFVPVAIFSALTVSTFTNEPELWDEKSIAFLVAGVYLWKTKRLGLSLFLGLGVFYLLTNK